jgi:hypothetical protein
MLTLRALEACGAGYAPPASIGYRFIFAGERSTHCGPVTVSVLNDTGQ